MAFFFQELERHCEGVWIRYPANIGYIQLKKTALIQ